MKLSRRGFLSKTLKGLAVAAIAPILPAVTKSITANPVPNTDNDALKGRAIKVRKYEFSCKDFQPQVTIAEYKPGETIAYQDLSEVEPSCMDCQYAHACTANGKQFVKHEPDMHKPFIPEIWSKKLHAKFYEKTILDKFL
jgi:hypothetical protein